MRANQYATALKRGEKLPFTEIVSCNIGNPQELGQIPITFFRQVLACMDLPALTRYPVTDSPMEIDAQQRAVKYLASIGGGGLGAYSHSQGIPIVREEIAEFITNRDNGIKSHADNIFLTDGASPAVQNGLKLLIRSSTDGILTPTPQYPLYSASITLLGGSKVPYFLDEENGWSLSVSELERALRQARSQGIECRALVVINPGNPTGSCLPRDNIAQILEFCARERLVMLADEVYQENIYDEATSPFISFKQVLHKDLPASVRDNVEMMSFHSISKGFVGECGRRGGYVETVGFDAGVLEELYKLQSVNLCPNTSGQIMMGLKVNPPRIGDVSYPLYRKEKDAIIQSLGRRAAKLTSALNKLPGVVCQPTKSSMYAFPRITLPPRLVETAKRNNQQPDMFYALECLAQTGIVIVPGSGFGQRDGTFHFRTTFLPAEEKIDKVISLLSSFHTAFIAKYQ
jgi:alanine transaminase